MSSISAISVPPQVEQALQQASRATGTDFDYLLNTAIRESGLRSDAKSKTSSATGLFQFVEQTWLGMIKSAGQAVGLGHLSSKIESTADGRHKVTDPKVKQEILALRKDPETSAVMAGAYTQDSSRQLQNRLGRQVSNGELYIAHFLGPRGAGELISAVESNPQQSAVSLFPRAAAANKSIFYSGGGRANSVAAVYDRLVSHHNNEAPSGTNVAGPIGRQSPVISPAAANFLAPANFAARSDNSAAAWGHGLFAQRGPIDIRPDAGSSAQHHSPRARSGPLKLTPAALGVLEHNNGWTMRSGETADKPANVPVGDNDASRKAGPNGLLRGRVSFHTLFAAK